MSSCPSYPSSDCRARGRNYGRQSAKAMKLTTSRGTRIKGNRHLQPSPLALARDSTLVTPKRLHVQPVLGLGLALGDADLFKEDVGAVENVGARASQRALHAAEAGELDGLDVCGATGGLEFWEKGGGVSVVLEGKGLLEEEGGRTSQDVTAELGLGHPGLLEVGVDLAADLVA